MPDKFAISAGTIVPMNSPPIRDGAVVVSDGIIESVTSRAQVPSGIPVEGHPDSILLPGLVNAHTHLVLTSFRGLMDDADFFTWLVKGIIPLGIDKRESKCRESAAIGIGSCFRHGITTLGENHYTTWGYDAMRSSGMKGVFFYEVFGLGTLDLPASINRHRDVIEKLASESSENFRVGISPHAPYSVTPSMAGMAHEMARKYNLPISTHVAETRDEVAFFLYGEGGFSIARRAARFPTPDGRTTSLMYFDNLGLIGPATLLVHGIHLSDHDLDIVKSRGATIVTCPTSNAKTAVGIARAGAWMNRDIPICIGTDSPASGETYDLFEEMRRFVLFQRAITGETDKFTARPVLEMVTVNPAKALGMETMVGDLREGSCADLLLITHDTPANQYRDVYQALLWDTTPGNITAVWSDGREVYRK